MSKITTLSPIIQADRHFRNKQYKEALRQYELAAKESTEEALISRAIKAAELCRILTGKKILAHSDKAARLPISSGTPHNLEILDALLQPINDNSMTATPFQGADIIDNGALNVRTCLTSFTLSPWQTSLGYITSMILTEYGLSQAILSSTLSLDDDSRLTYAHIASSYLDPRCSYILNILTRNRNKKEQLICSPFQIARTLSSDCSLKNIQSVDTALRKAAAQFPRYIIDPLASAKIHRLPKCNINAGSIFLNEERFIWSNLANHYGLVDRWTIVEGACKGYPERKVSQEGLSKDLSFLKLSLFPDPTKKLNYVKHGWTKSDGEAAKCEMRNRYLYSLAQANLVVIDIDEFYLPDSFEAAIQKLEEGYSGVVLPQMHLWKKLNQFVTGAYYDVSHMRFFRTDLAARYVSNHNFPELPNAKMLNELRPYKFDRKIKKESNDMFKWTEPYCVHCGFAKDPDDMKDKTDYYINRGEKVTRPTTTESRISWFTDELPEKCKVRFHNNVLPRMLVR
jgi:hypothetical protein